MEMTQFRQGKELRQNMDEVMEQHHIRLHRSGQQIQKYIQHIHIIMMGYFIQPQQNYWMHLAIHSIVLR